MKFKKYSTATDTYTTLPATFLTSGADVENYQIFGASSGVGEETENLFPFAVDNVYSFGANATISVDKTNYCIIRGNILADTESDLIPLEQLFTVPTSQGSGGTGYLYIGNYVKASRLYIRFYDENNSLLAGYAFSSICRVISSYTAIENKTISKISFYTVENYNNLNLIVKPMVLQTGAETTYIPFGYKIPILLESEIVTDNLFDKNATDTNNGYVDGYHLKDDGTTGSNSSWAISEYMLITGGLNYTFNYGTLSSSPAICYYDSDKHFISGVPYGGQKPKTVSVPQNVSYIRFSFMKSYADDIMFVQGSSLPDHYIPHRYESNYDLFIGDSKLYEDEYLDFVEQKMYKRTENLFDKNAKDTNNGYVRWHSIISTGAVAQDSSWDVTEYINVKPSTVYTASNCVGVGASICFYDTNKEYISGIPYNLPKPGGYGTLTFTTPNNCAYARTCVLTVNQSGSGYEFERNVDVFMITEDSTVPTSYIPYLQPTDPPAPFPTLATYIGENNLSVDTTVQPEKVVLTVTAWREIEAKKYVNGAWTDIVVRRYENGVWVPSPIPENNIANLQGLLTLLEDHWLPGVNDYRSMILVRTNRNDDTANQLCYMLTCYSTNPSPHFASEFLNNRYWLNDFAEPYRSGVDFYLRKFSWTQGGGWVYDGDEDNKRDDYFVPIDSNTYNVYLLRLGSNTQYDNNAGYQYFYDLSAYF